MKLKDMAHGAKCLVLGAVAVVGLSAFAAEPISLGEVKSQDLFGAKTMNKKAEITARLIKVETADSQGATEIGNDGSKAFCLGPSVYGHDLRRLKAYLYEIWYDNYEDSDLTGDDAPFLDLPSQYRGGCSSVRVGNFHGRNLDIGISDTATIVVHMKAREGRFASVGTSQWGDASETALRAGAVSAHRFDVLPNWMTDGINENGVAINVNVIPLDVMQEGNDPTSDPRPALHARKVVRYVLDHAESAAGAIEKLKGFRIYGNIGTGTYNLHWMISDHEKTFVVEVIGGEVVAREHPIMTNFSLNWDNANKRAIEPTEFASWSPSKYEDPAKYSENPEEILKLYTRHAEGVERYIRLRDANYETRGATFEGMFELMREVQFTRIVDLPLAETFLSDLPELEELEDAGIKSLTDIYAASNATKLADVWVNLQPKMQDVYANLADYRKPDMIAKYSITTHNVTFDLAEKMFRIVVQEEYDEPFDFYLAPLVKVMLPAGVRGFTYAVSNLTAGIEMPVVSVLPGGVTYELPIGAKVGVYAVPAEGFLAVGEPYIIGEVTAEMTLAGVILPTAVDYADTVVYGTIRTAEEGNPLARALAVRDGKFVYVGNEAGVAAFVKPGVTKVIDHRGKGMVMPGCTDGHSHYIQKFCIANMKGGVLFAGDDDKAAVLQKLEAATLKAKEAGKKSLLGFGWNYHKIIPAGGPTLKELDDATLGVSTVIFDSSGHSAYCNSECLRRCKIIDGEGGVLIDKIDGGLLELDENGYPTGYVDERVTGYLTRMGGIDPDEIVDDELAQTSIRLSQELLLSTGYTIAFEGWSNVLHPTRFYVAANGMDNNGELKIVFPMTYEVEPWQTNIEDIEVGHLAALKEVFGTKHVLPEYLKVFMDGCAETKTGAMSKPYKDGTVYKSFWSVDRLAGITKACNEKGLVVHTHVMGDVAITEATDAYIKANTERGNSDCRNCLVHLRNVNANDFQRFADNNISCTAGLTWHLGGAEKELGEIMEEDYVNHSYPIKSFFDVGAKVSSHSDFPANGECPQNPFGMMHVAVTGQHPNHPELKPYDTNELVTIEQAFQTLTINGAWQVGLENERGSIAVGKWADFVLADQDVFTCSTNDIGKTKVVSTWFEGEKVYPLRGSGENPWNVGATTNDAVTAYTNGTTLVVEGRGAMKDFGMAGPWGTSITAVDFGAQVLNAGANAFAGCTALRTLVMGGNPPAIGEGNVLSGVGKIIVREDALEKFEADSGWNVHAAKFETVPVCYDYAKVKTLAPFLHEVWYDDYVFDGRGETLSGEKSFACSSVRNGNFIGRNFDFFLDDKPEFVVHVAANPAKGRLASVGMAMHTGMREDGVTNGQYTASYDLIPNRMLDGINEKGVAINQNVVAYDPEVAAGPGREFTGTNPGAPDLNISFVTRMVLDRATNAAHAVELVKSHNLFGMSVSGDLLHYMISDPRETYVVEIITNTVVARHFRMMTNFNLNWDNGNARALTDADAEWTRAYYPEPSNLVVSAGSFAAATNELAKYYARHAEGVERFIRLRDHYDEGATFEGMETLMRRVQYSQASTFETWPYWYSDRCSVAVDRMLTEAGYPTAANTYMLYGLKYYQSEADPEGFLNESLDRFLDRELMAHERECLADKDAHRKENSEVWLTVHNTIYDIEKRMFRVAVQEDYEHTHDIRLVPCATVKVGDSAKTLGEEDPAFLATNFTIVVTEGRFTADDFAGYCVRAKGEAAGDYAVNFVCTRMPKGYDGEFIVIPGGFRIVMGGKLPADGVVTYPRVAKGSDYLKPNAYATWRAKPDACSVFVKWVAAEGALDVVTNLLESAGGKVFKTSLTLKIPADAQVRPADVVATWKRLDEDVPAGQAAVMLRCDSAMGTVRGSGLYKLALDRRTGASSKKVSITATAKAGYVFAGWYLDPGFSRPAYDLVSFGSNKDYRQPSQTITVTTNTYLFARFVKKTTKDDPIAWLRYAGAGYCGTDASVFSEEDEVWYQGVQLPTNGCLIAFGSASLPTVMVSGLPSGVKFDKGSLRFTGAPTACSTGKKPFFTVKITVRNKSGATDVLVKNIRVEPLPQWAVGNFDGYHIEAGATNGTFTATVGKTGKVSGKTKGGLADTTFSAKNFASVKLAYGALCYVADVTVSYKDPETKKTVKQVDTLYLMENADTGLGVIGGGDEDGCGSVGVQRAWDRKDLPEFLPFATGTKAPTLTLDNGIVLRFGAKGKVTVAGKVTGDNGSPVTVSGSTYVLPIAWQSAMTQNLRAQVYVYVAPKKNLKEGVSEVCDIILLVGASGSADKFDAVERGR